MREWKRIAGRIQKTIEMDFLNLSFCFSLPFPHTKHFLSFFKIYGPFPPLTIVTYTYVYACIFLMHWLCLYNVKCVYAFRADHLIFDNQLSCSSLRKAISPFLSILQLPVIVCIGRGLLEFPLPFDPETLPSANPCHPPTPIHLACLVAFQFLNCSGIWQLTKLQPI